MAVSSISRAMPSPILSLYSGRGRNSWNSMPTSTSASPAHAPARDDRREARGEEVVLVAGLHLGGHRHARAPVAREVVKLVPRLVRGVEAQRAVQHHVGQRHAVGHAVGVHRGHDAELALLQHLERLVGGKLAVLRKQGVVDHGSSPFVRASSPHALVLPHDDYKATPPAARRLAHPRKNHRLFAVCGRRPSANAARMSTTP